MIDSYHSLHPFCNMIIQGVLLTPLFIISLKKAKQPIELLQFFILYSSILDYGKGICILALPLYLLTLYCFSQWNIWFTCQYFLLCCCLVLNQSLYHDLINNGNDIFAVYYYLNCCCYLLYSSLLVKYLLSSICLINKQSKFIIHSLLL